jgi:four helix bundle protein
MADEGLDIFHAAVDFSVRVHELVKKFPTEERFDLASQVRRGANSIVLNIAEGAGRGTKKDFAHFLDMAIGSTFETVACFFLANKRGYIFQIPTWSRSGDKANCSARESTLSRRH